VNTPSRSAWLVSDIVCSSVICTLLKLAVLRRCAGE
jgi:hypothetical protein